MPARLILNADDFGLTPGINRAIAELHAAGALTSATLMANGPAFDDAVAVAHTHPSLGVGCHIVLTDGIPVAPLERIPGLLGPDRKTLRPSLLDFIQALLLGKIKAAEIELEALFQIHKLQRAGIKITHLDTHKHTHVFPIVARRLLALAESNRIPAIRNPFEPAFSVALNQGSLWRRLGIRAIGNLRPRFASLLQVRNAVGTTDGTVAISATGELSASSLAEILSALPPTGTYELCCHPGYNDADLDRVATRLRGHRDLEREALLTEIPRVLIQPNAPRLIHYGEM
jgi:chitin disaccharide deacetylase